MIRDIASLQIRARVYQPAAVRVRKRAEQHGIRDAKDRSARTDAQRQCEDCRGSERRARPQGTGRVAEILPHAFEKDGVVHAVDLLCNQS
jgi:hypothetical protein